MDIKRVLNSIGKENFVTFYDEYRKYNLSNNKKTEREILAQNLLKNNSRATDISGQYTRINCANRIFEAGLEKEALKIILEARVSSDVKIKVKGLLSNY